MNEAQYWRYYDAVRGDVVKAAPVPEKALVLLPNALDMLLVRLQMVRCVEAVPPKSGLYERIGRLP